MYIWLNTARLTSASGLLSDSVWEIALPHCVPRGSPGTSAAQSSLMVSNYYKVPESRVILIFVFLIKDAKHCCGATILGCTHYTDQ